MPFPLGFSDISLWLAVTTIVLLLTSEFINPQYGRTKLYIRYGRLGRISIILWCLFLFTVAIRIYQIIINL